MQTEVTVEGPDLVVEPLGINKVRGLRGRIVVPLAHVVGVEPEPDAAHLRKGIRAPGYAWPGTRWVGTFYRKGTKNYWNVRAGEPAVRIDLSADAPFDSLYLSVGDPTATVALVRGASPST